MDLKLLNFGVCVYAARPRIYYRFDTDDMVFATTMI